MWSVIPPVVLICFVSYSYGTNNNYKVFSNNYSKIRKEIPPNFVKLTPDEVDPNVSPLTQDLSITNSSMLSSITDVNIDDVTAFSKLCKCIEMSCDCCRDFTFPIISLSGPACAKVNYLGDQRISMTFRYGDIILASRIFSGKNAKPICISLPGGYSQFCSRIYGLSKTKENFKACLALELRAEGDIEAALRVSCFNFTPAGLSLSEAAPLPPTKGERDEEYDDDLVDIEDDGEEEYNGESGQNELPDDENYDDDIEESFLSGLFDFDEESTGSARKNKYLAKGKGKT